MMIRNGRIPRSPIGLDISQRHIRAVQLSREGSSPQLVATLNLDRVEPDGTLSPNDLQRLNDALRRRGFLGRHIVTAVPAQSTLTGVLELPPAKPGVPLEQIAQMEMARSHGREADEIEVAFWNLPESGQTKTAVPVMAAACAHREADLLLDALEAQRFVVIGLDIQGWAMARAFGALDDCATGVVAAVNLGLDAATFVLLYDGVLIYQRTLEGCATDLLGQSIQAEHRFADEVIHHVVFELGFEIEQRGEPADVRIFGRARPQIDAHAQTIAQELNLSMQYASHAYPDAQVHRLLLTGDGAAIPGLADHMTQCLDAATVVVNLADVVQVPQRFATQAQSTTLTIAAGLAQYCEEAIQ